MRAAIGIFLVLLTLDVLSAQVLKQLWDPQDVRRLERAYRIESSTYHHGFAPNISVSEVWGNSRIQIHTNSLGFRDAVVRAVPLKADVHRLLVLGDSFIEGVGVEFEDSVVGRMNDSLAAENIEVLNAAVRSYSPSIYYRKLHYLIEDVGLIFDTLLVFIDISDIEDEARSYGLDNLGNLVTKESAPIPNQRRTIAQRVKSALKANSVIIQFADTLKDTIILKLQCPSPIECMVGRTRARWTMDDALFEEYGREGLQEAEKAMDRVFELAERHNIDMAVAVYPWPDQVLEHDLESLQVQFWRDWAQEKELAFINLFPFFIRDEEPEAVIDRFFIPYDVHWNKAGNAIVAQEIVDWWRSRPTR